jgi:hypothetical protein
MKIRCFAFSTDVVFMLALTFILTVCRVPAGKSIAINISGGGVSFSGIDKAISDAIARDGGNDGSAPDKPLDLIVSGLDFDNAPDMINLFSALQKYYVNLTFEPGSGPAFNALPFSDTVDKSKIFSITLRGEVTRIGHSAFYGWTGLTTVNLPYAISIEKAAFYNCTGLKTINFPSAISIADGTFRNCTSLETINLPMASFIGDGAFRNCTALQTISLPGTIFIGDSVFYGCTNLERVELSGIQFLGRQVFSNTGNKPIELVFTLPYPPKFTKNSGAGITAGINLFGGSPGKQVMVNAPAYFGNYETWGKKNGPDTEKAAVWGDDIIVTYTSE